MSVYHVGHRALAALIAIVALVIALHQPVAAYSSVGISNAVVQVSLESGSGTDPLHSVPCCSLIAFLPEGIFELIFWNASAGVAGGNPQDAADLTKPPSSFSGLRASPETGRNPKESRLMGPAGKLVSNAMNAASQPLSLLVGTRIDWTVL